MSPKQGNVLQSGFFVLQTDFFGLPYNEETIAFLAVCPVISQPFQQALPSTADLPCSDDTPVDN